MKLYFDCLGSAAVECNNRISPIEPDPGPIGTVVPDVALECSEASSLSLLVLLGIFLAFFNAFGLRPRLAPGGACDGVSSPLNDFLRLRHVWIPVLPDVDNTILVVGFGDERLGVNAGWESSFTDRGLCLIEEDLVLSAGKIVSEK